MDSETVERLLRLSALELDEDARARLVRDLGRIVALIDEMQSVDTEGVEPLAHPLDAVQPLRPDRADPKVDRAMLQQGAPATRDGLYLVPRVVE
ncbi:MAG: Asp-tRNA(Asn)/Glu-tRNA(Gln) amidotransferase subunit GatC [Gammaproteobacteria bacterium]|nr:Asp-tRNA(Asn)/Glu-tRNA(Gln) amidotransferase subunit GatC [Gammaproteobacteria bacterium]